MNRLKEYRFCPRCGGKLESKIVKRGEPARLVCLSCDFVFYIDPKIAACTIVESSGKILLLKRAIEPAGGAWVIPGGFVDVGETVLQAAVRETKEEALLDVEPGPLVGVYSYPGVSVIVIVYEAQIIRGIPGAGDESLEAGLFLPSEIPWPSLAFTSTMDALKDYLDRRHPEATLSWNRRSPRDI